MNSMIYNELKELNSPLADISNRNVFTVPEGYFESLSLDIIPAINEAAVLDDIDIPSIDMQVPEGYFEGLSDSIMAKIKEEESADAKAPVFMAGLTNNVFTVPEGYFNGLADEIMLKIKSDQSEELSPVLSSLRDKKVFAVPEGYFENLADNILANIPRQPGKVVTMTRRFSIFKYAIAAAVTGIIGISLFGLFDQKAELPTNQPNTIAAVKVSPSSTLIADAFEILKTNSFDKEMEKLNDEEIVNYLKSTGGDVNAALVASVTDESGLPNADEYLIDEQALDKFLNEQHIVQTSNN